MIKNGADAKLGGGMYGTNLSLATSKLNFKIVKLCLEKGCSPNLVDFDGKTPLHLLFLIFARDPKTAALIGTSLI